MHTLLLFVGGLGGWEIFLIIAIIMIFFGAKKLPELAKGLGTGIREFKSSVSETSEKNIDDHPDRKQQNTPGAERKIEVEVDKEKKATTHQT